MFMTTAITRNLHYIFDPHPASEECNCQEEANNQYRNQHKHPRDGLEATVAQSLEYTCTEDTDSDPPDHTVKITDYKMVERTGDGNQKNGRRRLT